MRLLKAVVLSVLWLFFVTATANAVALDGNGSKAGKGELTRARAAVGPFGNMSSHSPKSAPRRYRDGELLVKFKPVASDKRKDDLHKKHGSKKLKEFKSLRLHHLALPKGVSVEEAVRTYRAEPEVEYAEPNYLFRAMNTPNDQYFGNLWGMTKINAPTAWDSTTGSGSVVVGVIDSGIDYNHPDLAANAWTNSAEIAGNGINDDGNGYVDDLHGINAITRSGDPMDDHGHGTHVAGTIGAVGNNGIGVAGVNWNVKVMGCKFLDAGGSGSTDAAVTCLQYMKSMKDGGVNLVATNNSWGGGGYSQALYDAIKAMPDVLFIAAAGNDSSDNDAIASYPSGYDLPNIVAVAATDSSDNLAYFSNRGRRTVHVGAPGVDIVSLRAAGTDLYHDQAHFIPNGDSSAQYYRASGTSMAAPHAAGVAALIKAQNPARDWRSIKNLILTGGDQVSATNGTTITGKRINAYGSLNCNNAAVFSVLKAPRRLTAGTAVTLSVLSINCGSAAGPVTMTSAEGGEVVTLSDDGAGADTAAGDGVFTATWTPSHSEDRLTFSSPAGSERVTVPLLVIGSYLPAGNLNAPYSQPLPASGGKAPYSWLILSGALPPGLTFNSGTGVISGTPTVSGPYSFTAQVTDARGDSATEALTLEVGEDPVAELWARNYDLVNHDLANDVALGPDGNLYVAGSSQNGTDFDASLACYDPSGNLLWSKTYDGQKDERGYGIALDAGGNIYLAATSEWYDSSYSNYLTLKFDSAGNLLWDRTFVRYNDEVATDIAVDSGGNAYVTGYSMSTTTSDFVTVKYDPSGTLLWSKVHPGDSYDIQYYRPAIAVDTAGNSVITGEKLNLLYCGPTCATPTRDMITVKYDPSGELLWDRTHDATPHDGGGAVAMDGSGNAYVTGSAMGAAGWQALTVKYDPAGNIVWTSAYPSESSTMDGKRGIVVDAAGNSFVGTTTYNSGWLFQVAKLDPSGNLVWIKTSGNKEHFNWGSGIAADNQGNVYASGYTYNGSNYDFLTIKYRQIADPFRIATLSPLPPATTGTAYSRSIIALGGTGSLTWSISYGSLPSGLTLNGSTGAITGTPSSAGSYSFNVRVADATTAWVEQSFSLQVDAPVAITTTTLAPCALGSEYSQIVEVSGGVPDYWWTLAAGELPEGLGLYNTFGTSGKSSYGTISGVCIGGGQTFTLQVKDGYSRGATKVFTITSNLDISNTTLPSAKLNAPYNGVLNATGGYPPYSWSVVSGSLPAGLSLDSSSGAILGTPTTEGSSTFSVRVADTQAGSQTRSFTIAVYAPKQLYAWGYNGDGQLGDGTTNNRTTPAMVTGVNGFTAIAAAGYHTIGLQYDGTVFTWGANWSGELGDGTTAPRHAPGQVAGLSGVTAIAAGPSQSMALKGDGTVWSWGYAPSGNAGTPYAKVPVQVSQSSGLVGASAIASGYGHSLALKSDGTVWSWGYDYNGQLGNGSSSDQYTPMQIPGLSGVVAVAAGLDHSAALKSDGTVWTWGRNDYGQLGDGSTTNRDAPVQVPGLAGVKAIAAGNTSTFAVKQDGSVVSWGDNYGGQLGDGTNTQRNSPVPVVGLSGVTSIVPGMQHFFALKGDGTAWGWGRNPLGELANSTGGDTNVPMQLLGLPGPIAALAAGGNDTFALAGVSIQVSPASLPGGTLGVPYAQTLTASGGTAPYSWTVYQDPSHFGSLPDGLTLTPSTGAIGGVPTASGSYSFWAQATDADGYSAMKRLFIDIASATCSSSPLRVIGAATTFFSDFPSACLAAADNDTIELQAVNFSGNLDFERDIRVTLKGGYDCDFAGNAGSTVITSGRLRVTNGTVTVDKLRFR